MMVIMMMVVSVVMTVMVGIVSMMMVVTMMIAVPSRGWSCTADGDCADNAQCRSNFRYDSHDAFLLLVLSSFDDTLVALNAA
jgi:hypothetical protein